jgi:uncharacterized protein
VTVDAPDRSPPWPGPAMDSAECLSLLSASHVGRLAFTDRALPAVVPVPYVVHDGHVVVPVRSGTSVVAAVHRAVVAFQVDSYRGGPGTDWSVTVVGPSRVVAPGNPGTPPTPWAGGQGAADCCYVLVRMDLIDGWRTEVPPVETGGGPESA